MAQVHLRNLSKTYGNVEVIKSIDLTVESGEFMVFVGPSGCGKSTTLRMIAGLETISGGDVLIDGVRANDIHPADRGAAMVFQSYALYPHMTVADNMGFALKMAGQSKPEIRKQVQHAAETLRMTELLERYPKDLSGGQRQRVAIGRAIVRKPKVFLFDEPLSNLDAALRVNMRIELSRLHKELGTTMIYVTHDQVEAMTMGSRIAVFNGGKVEQLGAPLELYNRPANTFVAGFLGAPRINLIPRPTDTAARSNSAHQQLWQALTSVPNSAGAAAPGAQVQQAAIRPENVHIVPAGQGVPAVVVLAEHLGDTSIVHLRVDGIESLLHAKIPASKTQTLAPNTPIGLIPDADWVLHYGADDRLLSA